jgi:glucose/arabinose dehydrogenase
MVQAGNSMNALPPSAWSAFVLFVGTSVLPAALPEVRLVEVNEGELVAPVDIVHAGDGSGRLFIADQLGRIDILDPATGALRGTPFLDLAAKMVPVNGTYDERGLLGLAFHPDYATVGAPGEGKLYVYYSAPSATPSTAENPVNHASVVAEYTVSAGDPDIADAGSERILLTFDQPQGNHNGGDLAFGPDGMLYVSSGDGGSSNDNNAGHTGGSASRPADALGNGQDRTNLLGKILRIDPSGTNGPGGQYGIPADNPFVGAGGGVREEIYAYGLRNPWRMSFDPETGRLFVADVGQGSVEEVNLVTSGGNYGWRNREGGFAFAPSAPGTGPFVDPVAQYAHPGVVLGSPALPQIGVSVTGGEVYRGGGVPGLYGTYVFADWSATGNTPAGVLLALEETSPGTFALGTLTVEGGNPVGRYVTALGSGEDGELYVATRTTRGPAVDPGTSQPTGAILRLAPALAVVPVTLAADRDNTIFSDSGLTGNSNGAGEFLFAGHILRATPGERRALVRFDLSPLPADAVIQSATVNLHLNRDASAPTLLQWHRATSDWGEGASNAGAPGGEGIAAAAGDATWIHRFHATTAWGTAGGEFSSTVSAAATVGGLGAKSWSGAQLAQDVQDWLDGTHPNHGWVLRDPGTEVSAKRFASREATNPALRPSLSVTYVGDLPPAPMLLGLAPESDTGPDDGDGVTSDTTPTVRGVAPPGSAVRILADGIEVANFTVTEVPFAVGLSALADGTRVLTATVTEGGVTGPASAGLTVVVDTEAPVAGVPDLLASSDSGVSDVDNLTGDATPDLTSAGGAGITVVLTSDLDGEIGSGPAGSPVTVADLSEGTHRITATATDLAGNAGAESAALEVTVDTTAPTAPTGLDLLASSDTGPSDADDETFDTTPTITGDAEEETTVALRSDVAGSVGTAPGGIGFEITTTALAPGEHVFAATAADDAGNESEESLPLTVTVLAAPDPRATKPVAVPTSEAALPASSPVAWTDAAAGIYDGLSRDPGDAETVLGAGSRFVVSVPRAGTATGGAVTGVVQQAGRAATVRGVFGTDGRWTAQVPVRGAGTVDLDLRLEQTTVSGEFVMRGSVSWLGVTAEATWPRAPFHARTAPLAAPHPGRYTALLPSESGRPADEPGGDGWAVVAVQSGGDVTVSGRLGDGTPFTEAAFVSGNLEIALFSWLYRTTPAGERGRVGGRLVLGDVPGVSDFDGRMEWRKFPDVREARYASGFRVRPWMIGSRHVAPAAGQRLLSQLVDEHPNAELSFIGTAAPFTDEPALDRVVSWLASNRIVHYGPERLGGTASTVNGAVSGGYFQPATGELVAFSGVTFQKQGIAAGVFLNGPVSGAVRILPGTTFSFPGSEDAGPLAVATSPITPAAAPTLLAATFSAAAAGRYGGVVTQGGVATGALEDVIVTAARAVSGTVWIEGQRFVFRGTVGVDGSFETSIPRRGGLDPVVVRFQLELLEGSADGFGLAGGAEIDFVTHDLQARRLPVFTRTSPLPQAGLYTLAVLAPDGTDAGFAPAGDGYGSVRLGTNGVCTGLVVLADGTRATLAGHVGRAYADGTTMVSEWSFHRGLYGRVPLGFVAGKVTFREVAGISDLDGEWRWVKLPGAPPATRYADGIDETRSVVGSVYAAPAPGERALAGLADAFHNIWLRFSGANVSALEGQDVLALDRVATWTGSNAVLYFGPERVTLSFNPRNGLLGGTFSDARTGVNVAFGGAVLQSQNLVTGASQGPAESGRFSVEAR